MYVRTTAYMPSEDFDLEHMSAGVDNRRDNNLLKCPEHTQKLN